MTKLTRLLRSLAVGYSGLWLGSWLAYMAFPEEITWWSFPLSATALSVIAGGILAAFRLYE